MRGIRAATARGTALLRAQPIAALTIILLWVAATRIFYMVLHDPMYGYANQFDVGRTAACLDMWPDLPGGPRDIGYFEAPVEKHRLVSIASQGCYPSAEVLVDWVALRLDGVRRLIVGGTDVVDMRVIGLFKALLLIATACVVSHSFRSRPAVALMHASILALVIADPLHTLYLNSLYGEYVAVFGAYAAICGLAGLVIDDERPSCSLAVFVAGVLFLAFSRVQHLLLPLFFVLLLTLLKFKGAFADRLSPRGRLPVVSVMVGLVLASVVSLAMNLNFVSRNPVFHEVNRNNMLFGALLPATESPDALVRALELPADCTRLVNSGYWRIVERGLKGACPEALAISPAQLVQAFAPEPGALATLFGRGLALSSGWRMRYVGEVALGDFAQVPAGPLGIAASFESITRKFSFSGYAIFWILPLVSGLISGASLPLKRWPVRDSYRVGGVAELEQLVLFSLAAVIASVWLSALLGDGFSELARHVHLGIISALASWTMLVVLAIRQRLMLATAITVAIATLLIVALHSLPLAVGALAVPHEDRAIASANLFSGWVISPDSVIAVDIEQHGRRLHRAQVYPSASLARYYPMRDGKQVFAFSFDSSLLASQVEAASPLRVYAVYEDDRRQLVDVRYP